MSSKDSHFLLSVKIQRRVTARAREREQRENGEREDDDVTLIRDVKEGFASERQERERESA